MTLPNVRSKFFGALSLFPRDPAGPVSKPWYTKVGECEFSTVRSKRYVVVLYGRVYYYYYYYYYYYRYY
jgi:hypothetical protein